MIRVEVKNPRRVQSSPGLFFTEYQLVVFRDEVQAAEAVEVYRRFRDFEWLHRQLHFDVPGVVIPVLPDKSAITAVNQKVGSASFLFQRGRDLTNFVNTVLLNDEVSKSESATRHVEIFLSGSSEELQMTKRPSKNIDATPPGAPVKRRSSGMGSFFKTLTVGSATTRMTPSFVKKEPPPTAEDLEIQDLEKESEKRLAQLMKLEANATTLIMKGAAHGTQLFILSQSSIALGENGCDALRELGAHCSALAAPRTQDHSERQITALVRPVKKQINLLRAINAAVSVRAEVKRASELADSNLSQRQDELEKGNASSKTTEDTKEELQRRVDVAQDIAEEKKRRFQQVTERLFREKHRTAQQRSSDMKDILAVWAKIHLVHCQKSLNDWQVFKEELGASVEADGHGGFGGTIGRPVEGSQTGREEAGGMNSNPGMSFRGEGPSPSFRGEPSPSFRGDAGRENFAESECGWAKEAPGFQNQIESLPAQAEEEPASSDQRYSYASTFNDEVSV